MPSLGRELPEKLRGWNQLCSEDFAKPVAAIIESNAFAIVERVKRDRPMHVTNYFIVPSVTCRFVRVVAVRKLGSVENQRSNPRSQWSFEWRTGDAAIH